MKTKKIPMRMCAVTRERFPKQELLRVIVTKEGVVEVDPTGKKNGHGAYIKKDLEVLAKAKKSNALGRALEVEIKDEIYEEIEGIIKESKKHEGE